MGRKSIKHDLEGSQHPMMWWMAVLDGKPVVRMKCARGHVVTLDHEVALDSGTVSPSIDCAVDGCDYHENVTLEGWSEHGEHVMALDPLQELEELGDAMDDDEGGPEGGGSIRA